MFRALSRILAEIGHSPRAVAPRRRIAALGVEALENRWVPSTFGDVTGASDALAQATTAQPTVVAAAPTAQTATTSASGAIAGTVYNDANGTGVYQTGDPVYANNPISLLNSSGATIGSTTTDANGHYQFAVDQTVSTAPAVKEQDLTFGPSPTDTPQALQVNQFDSSLGTLTSVEIDLSGKLTSDIKVDNLDAVASTVQAQIQGTLSLQAPGQQNALTANLQATEQSTVAAFGGTFGFTGASAFDFGAKDATGTQSVTLSASSADLSGFVGNGKATLTENSNANVCVCGPGNLLSLVQSTVSGQVKVIYHYTPSNALTPGTYTVVQTANPPNTTEGQNTSNGQPVPPGTPTDTIPVTLPPGGSSLHNDFGEVTPAKVSGYVYYDANHDAQFNAGDSGLGGQTVNLTGTAIVGGARTMTTQTAADGSYSFAVAPGTYTLIQPGVPGYTQDAANLGSLGGSVASGQLTVTVPAGANGVNYDFGEVLPPPTVPPTVPPTIPPTVPPIVPPTVPPTVPPSLPPGLPPGGPEVSPLPSKFDFLGSTAWGW